MLLNQFKIKGRTGSCIAHPFNVEGEEGPKIKYADIPINILNRMYDLKCNRVFMGNGAKKELIITTRDVFVKNMEPTTSCRFFGVDYKITLVCDQSMRTSSRIDFILK